MDIQEQIKDLTEKFEILLEKGVSVNKWAGAAEKRIKDNPQMGVTSRGKEELERLKLISKLPKDGKSANTVKAEMNSDAIKASNKALFTKDPKEKEKLEKEAWEKSLIATDNKGFCLNKYKAPKKMNDSNSYNEVVSQLLDLKEEFSNLFEVEGMGGSASDVPPSTNKVKKDVKTKDGKVELVSVEDELFPKDGNKREQFRQKVIDTINGMIQGTATLEDLLQVVRQKQVKTVKEGFEGAIEVLEQLLEEEEAKKERKSNKQHVYKRMDDPEKGKINVRKDYNRVIHNDSSSKDPFFDYVKIGGKKYRVRAGKIVEPIENNSKVFPMKEAIELLEDLINEVSDATIEGAVTCANNNVINADRNNNQKDIDRYKKIKKLASLRAEKTGRKLKANVDTGEYKHVNKNESIEEMVDEALEKSVKILELFDRPDLLNDVDSLLGSPVKKLINKTISSLKWKRKDKKVKTNKA